MSRNTAITSLAPAIAGNHSRSSSSGARTIRSRSCIIAKPTAYWMKSGETVARLEHDIRVRLQELQEISVADRALLVETVHDAIVHVGRSALVHDLGLSLGIEILRDVADDAQQLALPGLQAGGGLLEKIQEVVLRQPEQRPPPLDRELARALAGPS